MRSTGNLSQVLYEGYITQFLVTTHISEKMENRSAGTCRVTYFTPGSTAVFLVLLPFFPCFPDQAAIGRLKRLSECPLKQLGPSGTASEMYLIYLDTGLS